MKTVSDKISAHELNRKMRDKEPVHLIDVREPAEFSSEKIEAAQNIPLSALEREAAEIPKGKSLYLLCRSGNRASQAGEKLQRMGFENCYVVDGGLEAWKAAGLAVSKGPSGVWSMDRQIRMTAGSFVLLGLVLGVWVNPWFFLIAAFIASGLVYSAVTDTCGMAMMLAKMPWNRKK